MKTLKACSYLTLDEKFEQFILSTKEGEQFTISEIVINEKYTINEFQIYATDPVHCEMIKKRVLHRVLSEIDSKSESIIPGYWFAKEHRTPLKELVTLQVWKWKFPSLSRSLKTLKPIKSRISVYKNIVSNAVKSSPNQETEVKPNKKVFSRIYLALVLNFLFLIFICYQLQALALSTGNSTQRTLLLILFLVMLFTSSVHIYSSYLDLIRLKKLVHKNNQDEAG